MKFASSIVVFGLVYLLALSRPAWADAVYLKSGQVMRGRIVEKTQEYLVLKTGEGDAAVKNTIFLEDILRVETEEEYSRDESRIMTSLESSGLFRKVAEEGSFYRKIGTTGEDEAEGIRRLIDENRRLQGLPKAGDGSVAVPFSLQSKKGKGHISGIIRLPENYKEKRGPLYIYLLEGGTGAGFVAPSDMLYTTVQQKDIVSRDVHYMIEDVPSGTYGVFAQWDVASPFIEVRTVGTQRLLWNLGTKGDYTGAVPSIVALDPDEYKDSVNFNCDIYLKEDRIVSRPAADLEMSITDVYHRRNTTSGPRFFLSVRNRSDVPTPPLSFYVMVNDVDVLRRAMEFGPLAPKREADFDITEAYEAYKGYVEKEAGEDADMPKRIKIKAYWTQNPDISIEKTIIMF